MIRIHRPSVAPPILRNRGEDETERLRAQYDANRAEHDSGVMKFPEPKNNIYGSQSVRNRLKQCQNNKCCYSEAKFVRDSVHVEHYRPKGAIGQPGNFLKQYPGYYWLAYEWSNLLLCKPGVNSQKRDYFPLRDDRVRATNHHFDLSLESPMLIDPASEDPREHIRFRNEEPYAYRSSERGEFTINLLLNHPDLDEDRRTYFNLLVRLKDALEILGESSSDETREVEACIRESLNAAIQSDAKYSSMAIDLLAEDNLG